MTKRRSKTLLQQAKYYEVEGEYKEQEMMSIMESAYINGNFQDFKDYYHALKMEERRKFIDHLHCVNSIEGFYKMIDMLMFD